MKSHTDIEQSKKLAEILPLESADMGWYYSRNPNSARNQMWVGTKAENADIPCWSLAALLDVLKYPSLTQDVGNKWSITDWTGAYPKSEYSFDNPIDACVTMVEKLNERKLL